MVKKIAVFTVAAGLVGACSVEHNKAKSNAESGQNSPTDIDRTQEFFSSLDKLGQDESQRKNYIDIVEKLSNRVAAEAKKNPEVFASHIEEMILLLPKAGPMVALQVEEYANSALQNEMKRLREESGAAQLLEKEKIIHGLKNENSALTEKATQLEKELKKLLPEGVAEGFGLVFLFNELNFSRPVFVFSEMMSRKEWKFSFEEIEAQKGAVVKLPFGSYNLTIYEYTDNRIKTMQNIVVTPEFSCRHNEKWYNGMVNF